MSTDFCRKRICIAHRAVYGTARWLWQTGVLSKWMNGLRWFSAFRSLF